LASVNTRCPDTAEARTELPVASVPFLRVICVAVTVFGGLAAAVARVAAPDAPMLPSPSTTATTTNAATSFRGETTDRM
jgi:hypothetical protein